MADMKKNGWLRLDANDVAALDAFAADYRTFLSANKTERECHDTALALLTAGGFQPLDKAAAGAPLCRSFRGKTLFAARPGRRPLAEGCRILGAHIDSPRLDTKPAPLYEEDELALLDTHYYGGIRKYQWVSLPLALHGTVVREDGSAVRIVLGEAPDDPVLTITDLLPHLAQEQIKKTLDEGITGEGLNVLCGSRPALLPEDTKEKSPVKKAILDLLGEKYAITEEDLASAELEIVPAGPARELGFDRSMLLGYGHDDRVCAYAALRAFLDGPEQPEYTTILLLADKEEIGSTGATGMDSTFFENSLAELLERSGQPAGSLALRRVLETGRMLSADVSVCRDPNYPDVNSPNNTARMGYGTVISKYTGHKGKYAASEASAEFMAEVRRLFNAAGVFWQTGELGKVDLGGGGTISKFMARYGMEVLDCGPAVLSMHGPWEAVSKLDVWMAYKGYRAFLG